MLLFAEERPVKPGLCRWGSEDDMCFGHWATALCLAEILLYLFALLGHETRNQLKRGLVKLRA
jgi:hypothetical protein